MNKKAVTSHALPGMITSEDSDSQNDENLSAFKPAAQSIKSKKHKSGKKHAAAVVA